LKVFKFKKYKDGYEDRKRGASLRYPLEIGSFPESQGQGPLESSVSPAIVAETSPSVPSSDVAP